jgi:hypothetical protein
MVLVAVLGLVAHLRYVRACPAGVVRALKALACVALAYVALVQGLYVAGITLPNGWFEAAALALAAILAANGIVGRPRGGDCG